MGERPSSESARRRGRYNWLLPDICWIAVLITPHLRCLLVALSCVAAASRAGAQILPENPVRSADGRLVLSAEVIGTFGSQDDVTFFNYTDYEHNALRMLRIGTSAVWRPTSWLALAGELRSEDLEHPGVYAAYARIKPWENRGLTIDVGRIPPTFGAFSRHAYTTDNPVIGYPLAYQYLTSLRTNAVPAVADDLLRMRARGWLSSFPVGVQAPGPGVPLISGYRWDTGVQVGWKGGPLQVTGAVTNGTLSNPRVSDDNSGKQLSGRVSVTPATGLVVGVSGASGAWLARSVPVAGSPTQRALGADVEYSRDHWIVRAEMVFSRWGVPLPLAPSNAQAVDAFGRWIEGRYRITPRIFVAGRADRLGFSKLLGSAPGSAPLPWDAPVTRIESGGGYYLQRNLVARVTVQANRRSAGRVLNRNYVSAQIAYWF
jgi:hypothetical protein